MPYCKFFLDIILSPLPTALKVEVYHTTLNMPFRSIFKILGYPKGVYLVRIGDYKSEEVEPYEVEVNVENMYTHEDFRKGHHFNNDIAIVLLKNPVRYNDYVQPVCLPNKDTEYRPAMNCTISGWGAISSGSSLTSNDLRAGKVPIQANSVCTRDDVYGEGSITEGNAYIILNFEP